MNHSPNRSTDRLIEAAWNVHDSIDWALDSLAMGDEIDTDESIELCRIADASTPLGAALREFTRYSDGRPIRSSVPIVYGVTFIVVWPADPEWSRIEHAAREGAVFDGDWRLVLEGRLPVDPGVPDRGGYRVWVDDKPCAVRVEELPPAPRLSAVR
ncbi:hypothetical protein [Gordonia sp. ABSL49_1]|uniref:hypothetical protein n=1 Tax=Gordonia sp. ABSL49_1 TaxID=2920941 RepID=UPI001F0E2A06|nr:hypothetical protein [Gordonia sp. ABSL49_1]MCH5645358.1 hypothetical protein [Gordonia sp. ABSL49_1]